MPGERSFREIHHREGKVDSSSMKPDSIADGTDRRREAELSGPMRKEKRNRINEIAIIDTPILALKDPLAPCTSVRDIIDPAHAIARIPLRFN